MQRKQLPADPAIDKTLFGTGFFNTTLNTPASIMAERFIMPPFSVLDARQGNWVARKNAWISLGLKGEKGRVRDEKDEQNRAYRKTLDGHGKLLRKKYEKNNFKAAIRAKNCDEFRDKEKLKAGGDTDLEFYDDEKGTGTSIFDPVLTELCYRWFCPKGGRVLDPFAGGSTRGIVADVLGYRYTGIEVRDIQIAANVEQARAIGVNPTWILGDSFQLASVLDDYYMANGERVEFDMVIACPPYYDLEVYSSDTLDGSTHKTYDEFITWYFKIFEQAVGCLKDNTFVAIIVGEIRDPKTGAYRNFVADTIDVFLDLGLTYYNELILITRGGSLPLRAGNYFRASRKIGKTHQNLLVFWKGKPTAIKDVIQTWEI